MIVETKLGAIRGRESKSLTSGKPYYSFLGIPYAKPPLGELRFSPPVPVEKWDDVYDAVRDQNPCIQAESILSLKIMGSEDCLYLNVYTPELKPTTSLKPVMFYIHPGGFVQGTGISIFRSPDYLIDRDVILVSINYRLHILGFLNLQIPECPGNVGLKDQLLALQWVKENIEAFGGDPQNITIFGSSAGASSVNYLMISPRTKGLFQKAIIQSGTALSFWAMVHDPVKLAFRVGQKIGYQGDDPRCLLKTLKGLSSEDLVKIMLSLFRDLVLEYPTRCFPPFILPSVERVKENAFLPDYPENLFLTAEPRPCIIGHNSLEASIMWPIIPEPIRENPLKIFPFVIKHNFNVPEPELSKISENVRQFYFGDEDDEDKLQKMMLLLSDIFTFRFQESCRYLEKSEIPPYIYHFTYYNKEDRSGSLGIRQRLEGSFHGDEECFLFVQKYPPVPPKLHGDELKVRENICSLWTNFAKSGDPNQGIEGVTWKPSTIDAPCYLQIDQNLELKDGKIGEDRFKFLTEALSNTEVLKI